MSEPMTKNWVAPAGFRKSITLSNGEKVEVRVNHGMDTVEMKAYIPYDRTDSYLIVRPYKGVDGFGAHHKVKVRVKSTSIRLKMADGTVIESRSCCKYPDVFNPIKGVELASNRLIKGKCGGLRNDDRALIRKTINDTATANYKPAPKKGKTANTESNTPKIAAAARKAD